MSLRRRLGRFLKDARGAALIETAVTLPLMLLVADGIFEFGRAYQTWQVLTNAAREGARIAVLPGGDDASVEARVRTYLDAGRIEQAASAVVTITRDHEISIGTGTATASEVTVSYPFTFVVLHPVTTLIAPNSSVGTPLTMTASALMRNE
jgi:Flp pilus assembly protein TadG